MKHCPTCRRSYEDSQRFCPQDATPLVEGGPAWSGAGGAPQPVRQPASHEPPHAPRKRRLWPFVVGGAAVLAIGFLVLLALGAFFVTRSMGGRNANQTAAANVNAPGGYPPPPPGYNTAPPFGPNAPAGGMNSNMGMPPGGPMGGPGGVPGGPGGMNPDPNIAPGGMPGGPGMPGGTGAPGGPVGPGMSGGPGGGDGEVNVGGPEGDDNGGGGDYSPGGSGGIAGGPVPPELSRLENEFVRANVTGDRAALENILADNFVGAMAGGPQVNKQQFLQNVRPDQTIASFNIENMRAMERGKTAMVTGVIVLQTPQGPRRFRFADTYERQGGHWRLVNSQLAPG